MTCRTPSSIASTARTPASTTPARSVSRSARARKAAGVWQDLDVILTPALATPAPFIGGMRDDADPLGDFDAQKAFTPWTSPWNMLGAPAIAVPLHRAEVEGVTRAKQDIIGKGVKAGDLIREIAPIVGGRGGGRPELAQGGGTDVSALDAALSSAAEWVAQQ